MFEHIIGFVNQLRIHTALNRKRSTMFTLQRFDVSTGTGTIVPTAQVVIVTKLNGQVLRASDFGVTTQEALFKALAKAVGQPKDFSLELVQCPTARAAQVRACIGQHAVTGNGQDKDIVGAIAYAAIDGMNQLVAFGFLAVPVTA